MSTDSACMARHRSSARPGDLSVFHAGVRLELERRHDRSGMNLRDGAFDGELAAFLFEQARAFHQLALVDLPLGLRRIEQRQRRNRERAVAPRLPWLRIGQRQRRVLERLRPLGHDRRPALFGRRGGPRRSPPWPARARVLGGFPRDSDDRQRLSRPSCLFGEERLALPRAAPLVEPASERAEHARAAATG